MSLLQWDSCLQVQLIGDLAAEWCYALNKVTPADYTAKSMVDVWWQNGKRGKWKQSINSRFYNTCVTQVAAMHSVLSGAVHALTIWSMHSI